MEKSTKPERGGCKRRRKNLPYETMNWKILAVGKPALPWARQGIEDYLGRCARYAKVEVEYVKDGPRAQVEERFLKGSEGSVRIVLDERGKRLTTRE